MMLCITKTQHLYGSLHNRIINGIGSDTDAIVIIT